MPAQCFPCYPFQHSFEEKVTNILTTSLDDNFLLVHNAIRPNKRSDRLNTKEIDLCILSRTSTAFFVEIKNYYNPYINDISIEGRRPNPVQEMKEYGQRFRSDLEKYWEPKLYTEPVLIIPKKDSNKITKNWKLNCFEPSEFVDYLRQGSSKWERSRKILRYSDLERIREQYLCCADIQRFTGFSKQDFDQLRKSRKYLNGDNDEGWKRDVLYPLYYKFRWMAYEIRSYLAQKPIKIFQTVMSPERAAVQSIYWVAFTLRDLPNFHSDPQVAFHISTTDWYKSGANYGDHFTTKLAFFKSSKWMRRFLRRFRENPAEFIRLVKNNLSDKGYRLVASRDPNELRVNTPVSSSDFETDLRGLAKSVLDYGKIYYGMGFERPFYCHSHGAFQDKNELIKIVGPEFEMLLQLLREILPEYDEEVKNTPYQ